ncbi:MAG: sulfotransferase [Pseudomonadales bacterium]
MANPVVSLDADLLRQQARAETGLEDFGDESHVDAMQHLLDALNTEANLNEAGRAMFAGRIRNILVCRLRAEDWFRRHPEILEEEIRAPLAIVGLPRTGTTMMHRTIGADHRMYAPLWYEVRYPVPFPGTDFNGIDPRIAVAEAEVAAMLEASPELASIHPMDARGPDEDIMLLEQSFFSGVPESFAHMPLYGAWLDRQDQRPGYRYLKRLLQFLQWQKKRFGQGSGERWVLKAPHHLRYPAALCETFPDVSILQTHRDPVQTIPSYGSMMHALISPLANASDKAAIAQHWAGHWDRAMRATMQFRDAGHEHRFLDVWYQDTVAKPLEEIRRLYDFIGMPFTDEARAEMEKWRDLNRREERPSHQYTLEEYGFTEQGLKKSFHEYRERYILARPTR